MEITEETSHPDLKLFVKNKDLVTKRVKDWIGNYSKSEISELIGISRPTLNKRMESGNWKYVEIVLVLKYMPF